MRSDAPSASISQSVQRSLQSSSRANSFVERCTTIDSTDGVTLEAAVTPGFEDVDVGVIICHPWGRLGGSMRDAVVVSLRNQLSAEGFTVCRYKSVLEFEFRNPTSCLLCVLSKLKFENPQYFPIIFMIAINVNGLTRSWRTRLCESAFTYVNECVPSIFVADTE